MEDYIEKQKLAKQLGYTVKQDGRYWYYLIYPSGQHTIMYGCKNEDEFWKIVLLEWGIVDDYEPSFPLTLGAE